MAYSTHWTARPDSSDTRRYQTSKLLLEQKYPTLSSKNLSSGWFGGSGCNCCWKCVWVLHFNKKKKERKEGSDLWELWVPLLSLQLQFPLRRHTLKMCPLCLRPWTWRTWTCWTRTKRLEQRERGRQPPEHWWYRRACQAFGRTNYRGTTVANEHLTGKTLFQWNT